MVIDLIRFRSSSAKQTKIEMNLNEGSLKLGSWTIKENPNGHLMFLKDGTPYDNDYGKIPQDTGFVALAQDGNIWSNRSTGRGWLADNKLNVSGGNVGSLNINGNLNMGGRIALNDNPLMIRSMGDNNHSIKFEGSIDGPLITGNVNVGINRASDPSNPRLRIGNWTINRQQGRGNCGRGAGSSLVVENDNTKGMVISELGLVEVNTAWGWQGVRC